MCFRNPMIGLHYFYLLGTLRTEVEHMTGIVVIVEDIYWPLTADNLACCQERLMSWRCHFMEEHVFKRLIYSYSLDILEAV